VRMGPLQRSGSAFSSARERFSSRGAAGASAIGTPVPRSRSQGGCRSTGPVLLGAPVDETVAGARAPMGFISYPLHLWLLRPPFKLVVSAGRGHFPDRRRTMRAAPQGPLSFADLLETTV
jgi:hypothetical protein